MRKTRSQTKAEKALLATTSRASAIQTNQLQLQQQQQPMNNNNNYNNGGNGNAPAVAPPIPQPPTYVDPNLIKECEEMIGRLRVVELQKILSLLNISFSGRKIDYQRRITSLLNTHYDLVAHTIREVYAQSVVGQQINSNSIQSINTSNPKRMYNQMQLQTNAENMMVPANATNAANIPTASNAPIVMPNNGAQPVMNQGAPPAVPAVSAAVPFHIVTFVQTVPTQIPIHPDVRFKQLPFYDVLGTLIKPSSLVPRNAQRIQEVPFYFTLTPQQATELAMNRDIRNSAKIEHIVQVQLRFSLVETSCEQEDCFPPSVNVRVNNKVCQLPNALPQTRPNMEPKRPPRPINVTAHVKLSPTVTNTITVQWAPDYTRSFCLAVFLVRKLTSAELLQKLKAKGVKASDYTTGLIKEKMREDADSEIATTMLKVSLNCPLGKMKMSIPCRASTCSHLQCFDANLYLQMNEHKPTWTCPVCDKEAAFENLVIDGYFQEVLQSNFLKSDDTEIQLHEDGTWSTQGFLYNETQFIDDPRIKPLDKIEIVQDDIEVITAEPLLEALNESIIILNDLPTSTTNNETFDFAVNNETMDFTETVHATVDLTLSDSDYEEPLA